MEPLVTLAVAAPAAGAVGLGSYVVSVRFVRRCRRTMDAARTRTYAMLPGPRGDAARTRRRLAAEVASTAEVVRHCRAAERSMGDAAVLLVRLRNAAAVLDAELALL